MASLYDFVGVAKLIEVHISSRDRVRKELRIPLFFPLDFCSLKVPIALSSSADVPIFHRYISFHIREGIPSS